MESECVQCGDTADLTCDMCGDEICSDTCMDEHAEEYHGSSGDEW